MARASGACGLWGSCGEPLGLQVVALPALVPQAEALDLAAGLTGGRVGGQALPAPEVLLTVIVLLAPKSEPVASKGPQGQPCPSPPPAPGVDPAHPCLASQGLWTLLQTVPLL